MNEGIATNHVSSVLSVHQLNPGVYTDRTRRPIQDDFMTFIALVRQAD